MQFVFSYTIKTFKIYFKNLITFVAKKNLILSSNRKFKSSYPINAISKLSYFIRFKSGIGLCWRKFIVKLNKFSTYCKASLFTIP